MSLVALLLVQLAVESPREAFARAEALYQAQDYEGAAEIYETIHGLGIEDAALYYNLGNAYFKAGRLGQSVLSYERARRLAPGDDDIRTNLAYANELVADSVEPAPLPLLVRWVVDAYRASRPNALAWTLSVAFVVGGVAFTLLLYDVGRSGAIAILIVCGVIVLGSGAALFAKVSAASNRVEAIVLTDNAYVRSGPGDDNPRLAEIHEGLKVRVVAERSGWYQVALANGLTGWLRAGEIETI